jgi:hypothetical protein
MITQSNPATCSCTNGGQPWLLDGVSVISYDPACRVHCKTVVTTHATIVERKEVIDWTRREREK